MAKLPKTISSELGKVGEYRSTVSMFEEIAVNDMVGNSVEICLKQNAFFRLNDCQRLLGSGVFLRISYGFSSLGYNEMIMSVPGLYQHYTCKFCKKEHKINYKLQVEIIGK